MDKILTIIIPTYNMEKYLRRCLDSLLIDEEGMKQLEVLVINDGSKDSSSEIAHEYQDKYPDTFRVIDKENGNYGSCINRGLKEATGKYVKVLDADDWFDTQSFSYVLKKIGEINVDMILTNHVIVNDKGTAKSYYKLDLRENIELQFEDIVIFNGKIPMQMHCIIYKRSILNQIGYIQTECMSYTDTEWVLYPSIAVEKVMYFDTYLYCYLVGRDGQTVSDKEMEKTSSTFLRLVDILLKNSKRNLTSTDVIHKKFIMDYLYWQLKSLYYRYLVLKRDDLSELIEFEQSLDLSFISRLNNVKLYGVKYIHIWHKNKHKKISKWLYFYFDKCFLLHRLKCDFINTFGHLKSAKKIFRNLE